MTNNASSIQDSHGSDAQQLNTAVHRYLADLTILLDDTELRQDIGSWQYFLDYPYIVKQEFLDRSAFAVFSSFIKHFHSQQLATEGGFVPQVIMAKIATLYAWEERKSRFEPFFEGNHVLHLLNYSLNNFHTPITALPIAKRASSKTRLWRNVAIVAGVVLLYWSYQSAKEPKQQEASVVAAAPNFDERLLLCNEVKNAEPNDNFNACLALATEGELLAQRRMVWAYSRAGEHLSWQETYNWLKVLRNSNQNAALLTYAFMNVLGNTRELKEQGERGILRFANQNKAAANIILASIYMLDKNALAPTSNPLWLLERAYVSDPDLLAPIEMAKIYANGFASPVNLVKAKQILVNAAESFFPVGTNNVAWFLSTIENNPLTEDDYATSLAKSVIEDPQFSKRFTYIDTLAASYAAQGNFDLAITTQQAAIEAIETSELNDERQARILPEFIARLDMYKRNEAAIESELFIEKAVFFEQLKTSTLNRLLNSFYTVIEAPEATQSTN